MPIIAAMALLPVLNTRTFFHLWLYWERGWVMPTRTETVIFWMTDYAHNFSMRITSNHNHLQIIFRGHSCQIMIQYIIKWQWQSWVDNCTVVGNNTSVTLHKVADTPDITASDFNLGRIILPSTSNHATLYSILWWLCSIPYMGCS